MQRRDSANVIWGERAKRKRFVSVWLLWPLRGCCFLSWADFFCVRSLECVPTLQDGRKIRRGVTAEEQEEHLGALRTSTAGTSPKILLLSHLVKCMRRIDLWLSGWKISPLSIEKSIRNATQPLLVDLRCYSSAALMLFTHSFLYNQQSRKGSTVITCH